MKESRFRDRSRSPPRACYCLDDRGLHASFCGILINPYLYKAADRIAEIFTQRGRFVTMLFGSFAVLALALATFGLYSVVSYTVSRGAGFRDRPDRGPAVGVGQKLPRRNNGHLCDLQ